MANLTNINKLYNNKLILFDICFNNLYFNEVLDLIDYLILNDTKNIVLTPNVDHVVKRYKNKEFRDIYDNANLVLNDSRIIYILSKLLRKPLKDKISGSDLFPEVCKVSANKGYSIFLLGGKDNSHEIAVQKLKLKFPNIKISGSYSPPWGFEDDIFENNKIIEMINKNKTDILFLGLGTPKQEKWIYKNKNNINFKIAFCIGSSFDFFSGLVKRAPKFISYLGFEWLWRLCMDPKRLWKRYLIEDMKIFYYFFRELFYNTNKNNLKNKF